MAEPFNTLEAARKLQEAGCDQALAEEMASQINGAVSGTVATKADLELLRADIELLKSQLTVRLWTAIAAFVVLMKALDHLLPTVLG